MIDYILAALLFGLSAGLQPGPLGVIVIQQSLQNGLKSGLQASLAPLVTDGPIIIVALFILTQFKNAGTIIGLLSFIGGIYLVLLAYKLFKIDSLIINKGSSSSKSLATAIKVNFFSPNPYLFWFTVGGSFLIRGTQAQSITFIIVTVGALVLTKMFIALIAARFKNLLNSVAYTWVMKILAGFLFSFGIVYLVQSYQAFS